MVLQLGIDLRNRTADRRIQGGRGFGRFDFADLLPGLHRRPSLRQINEDDITQGILRKMTDTHSGLSPLDSYPFMLLMIAEVRWNHDGDVLIPSADDVHSGKEICDFKL